jgi:putative membrane protein
LASAGLLVALSTPVIAQNRGGSDTRFANDAAMGGMTEIQLGKLALQNGSSDKVKQFGQRLVDDHSKAGDELKAIAGKDNITLPSELDATHKAMVDKFAKMSGAEFDRAFISQMVMDHETTIAEFQKEANGGTSPDLKSWAGNTLPTLQDHLRMAKDDQKSLGQTSSR